MINATNGKSPEECMATIEDFFSDERDSESSSNDDDDMDVTPMTGKLQDDVPGVKKKKKKKKTNVPSHALAPVDLSPAEFRKRGYEVIDFIADYIEGARDRPVHHQAIPGYLFRKMPTSAPRDAVSFDDVIKDIKKFILPGITQWQSPKHHALMPLGGSYASLLGSILCDGLGSVSLTWNECPASVELEMVVMNWLAELMDLPLDFHFFGKGVASGPTKGTGIGGASGGASTATVASAASGGGGQPAVGGGGIIQSNTSECLLTVITAAKRLMLETVTNYVLDVTEWEIQERLIAYCSEQAHPCMERICEVVGVRLKRLWTDKEGIMHCTTLKSVLERDKLAGHFPFIVVATAGTIASASVDVINNIGPFLGNEVPHVWFHIDASYAGSSFICREYQPLLHGINYADSINVTAHKWLPIHMDCACLWVKKIENLTFTFACEDPNGPLTIPHDDKNPMADYREWSLPLSRRFRAIKIWVVFKLYGVKKLQQKIREDVRRAKEFEKMMRDDHRFEIMSDVMFGIVAFRCKRPDSNDINKEILQQINKSAVIKMTGARVGKKYWLRFVVAGRYTDSDDVKFSWEMIKRTTTKAITEHTERTHAEDRSGMPNYKYVVKIGQSERLDDKE